MSILILRPNGNSAPLEQTPSSGSNYTNIDEETINTVDYCYASGSSATAIKTDVYVFPNHSSETGTINSITVKTQCKLQKYGTGTGSVNPVVKIGSTVYESGDQNITEIYTYALHSYTWTTNPATSSAWTWTNVDDLLAGCKFTANYINKNNYGNTFDYQLWVEVDYTEGGASVKPYYYYLNQ